MITCPNCGKPVAPDAELCPHCGYPVGLVASRSASGPQPVPQAPGDPLPPDVTGYQQVVADPVPPQGGQPRDATERLSPASSGRGVPAGEASRAVSGDHEVQCAECGQANPRNATLCSRCGSRLRPADEAVIPPARTVDPPPPGRGMVIALVVVLLALLAVGGWYLLGRNGASAPSGNTQTSSTTGTGQPALVAVPPDSIKAAATSVQRPSGGQSFSAGETLDGDRSTAWNSRGNGVGAELVYAFDSPVDLRRITVLNGYQLIENRGGTSFDHYPANARVQTLRVTTPTNTWLWNLRDERAEQSLDKAFGTISTVRLTVVSIYPPDPDAPVRFDDVALSEVGFFTVDAG
jgi:ribosomal protein L40E